MLRLDRSIQDGTMPGRALDSPVKPENDEKVIAVIASAHEERGNLAVFNFVILP